jgi:hypothetical protein
MTAKVGCLAVVLLLGCGAEKSPVEKCDDLIDVLCDRGIQCLGGSHAECVQAFQSELPCGSAKAVSASYDRCIDQLQAAACSSLFPPSPQPGQPELRLPADCMSVILSRTGATPQPTSTLSMPRSSTALAQ